MRYVCCWLVALGSAAGAAEVGPCNDLDRISYLIGQTRSYSEGKIKIASVDTDGEPVCCSSHLLVFIPSTEIGIEYFQATHPEILFKECSHYVELVSSAGVLPQILARAMREAVSVSRLASKSIPRPRTSAPGSPA